MLNDEIKAILLKSGLRMSTIKRYNTWSNAINATEFNLEDYKTFHTKIDDEFKKRPDYTSILSVIIKILDVSGYYPDIYIELRRKAIGEKELVQKPTEKEIEKAITYDEIIKLRNAYYTLTNPTMRNDYELQFLEMITRMGVFRTEDYIRTSFSPEDSDNYVDLKNNKIVYTTGKTESSIRDIDMPPEVVNIITANKNKYKRKWLFPTLNASKRHPTADTFRNFVSQLFNRRIGTNLLRQIFVSHYDDSNMSKEERIEKARIMGHTYIMSQSHYTKLTKDKLPPKKPTASDIVDAFKKLIAMVMEMDEDE